MRTAQARWFTQTAERVLATLDVDAGAGLSAEEAARRLERDGPNEIAHQHGPSALRVLTAQFANPLVLLLLAAAVVAAVTWWFGGDEAAPYDALVILAIVLLNAALGFVQEYRAERAVEALQRMTAPEARVLRDGAERAVNARELVVGDIVLLEAGDRVPADARMLASSSLKSDESALTGESVAVSKDADPIDDPDTELGDRRNMVFMASSVTYGHGTAVVVATGMDTEMGDVAGMLQQQEDERTPLQEELGRVGLQLGMLVVVVTIVVAGATLLRTGAVGGDVLLPIFLFAVALAVAAVPEGLPAVVTAALGLGVRRLARRNAIVRRLPAVETLGSADVICTDKTGTITRNEMTVRRILLGAGREIEVTGEGFAPEGSFRAAGDSGIDVGEDGALRRFLRLSALNNDARLEQEGGDWRSHGDPTEGALVVAAMKAGIDVEAVRRESPRVGEIPFSGDRKRMTTVHELEGVRTAIVKGAPELLLERSIALRDGAGTRELDEAARAAILRRNEDLAAHALRPLGVASRALGADADLGDDAVESDLVFEGILAMIDPPREQARGAVEQAARAGVRTVLLTGDHILTARAVAREAGIVGDDAQVVAGREIERMDDEALATRVEEVAVFGRVGPGHKMRVLRALKRHGHRVAMTGDGVNDAPAIKEADIGVAMGLTGTAVAREASDIVLADDDYATLVAAISEGRRVYDNLRKFIRYLLSANCGEVLALFAAVMLAGPLGLATGGGLFLPLLPTQLLWINLITDGPPALALAVGPAEPDHMRRPPRDPDGPVIDRAMWIRIAVIGLTIGLGTLITLDAYMPGGVFDFMTADAAGDAALRRARTAAFTTLLMFEVADVFNCISQKRSVFRSGVGRQPWLLGAVALSIALHAVVLYWPPMQTAFQTIPLAPGDWLYAAAMGAGLLVVSEALKRTRFVND